MAKLTNIEKLKFEELFNMRSGYVLDFSDNSFYSFVYTNSGLDIFNDKYKFASGSKANRMRAFWNTEPDEKVGNLLLEILEYLKTKKLLNNEEFNKNEKLIYDDCIRIAERLSGKEKIEEKEKGDIINYDELLKELLSIDDLDGQDRGFAFEKFLNKIFKAFELDPRSPFKLVGEQIDGSFNIGETTYLVEAKYKRAPSNESELLIFKGKVDSKATWSRGIFISNSGFTKEGLEAFSKGKQTNIIGINGLDLYLVLENKKSLMKAINVKARRAVETGNFFSPIQTLMHLL